MSKRLGPLPLLAVIALPAIAYKTVGPSADKHARGGEQVSSLQEHVYYARCADARAAGVAPISEGQPGYRAELDADGDGIACEPYRGAD